MDDAELLRKIREAIEDSEGIKRIRAAWRSGEQKPDDENR